MWPKPLLRRRNADDIVDIAFSARHRKALILDQFRLRWHSIVTDRISIHVSLMPTQLW